MVSSTLILKPFLVMSLIPLIALASDFVGEQKSFAVTAVRKPSRQQRDATVTKLSRHGFSKAEQQEIVKAHNDLRKQVEPPASNMKYMIWHDELAHMAQTWAETCEFEHGQPEYDLEDYNKLGQNMWRGRNDRVTVAINSWYAEEKYYDFHTHTCDEGQQCGHYIQEVWARTEHVGCGVADCEGVNWNMIVCNYGPPGNYRGAQPYTVGIECSECLSPGWCFEGLCMPTCRESRRRRRNCECNIKCDNCGTKNKKTCSCTCQTGFTGPHCTEKCDNLDDRCTKGWYKNWCDDEHPYVLNKCPKMCSLCEVLDDYAKAKQCCGGMQCQNGGYVDAETCTCQCSDLNSGQYCEKGRTLKSSDGSLPAACVTLMAALLSMTFMVSTSVLGS